MKRLMLAQGGMTLKLFLARVGMTLKRHRKLMIILFAIAVTLATAYIGFILLPRI